MSSPSSIRTPSSPSVSFATTTASPLLTKNRSKSTDTTPQSSKAPAYQMVSGVYPYIPNNHKPTPCSPNKHNETSFNGSTPPPSVQVSALSSRPLNEIFSSPGPTLHPKSFAGTYNCPLPPPKAISTSNDNVAANHSTKRHHQHPSPHALTPFTQDAVILDPKQPTGNSFSDLTGRFPIQSNRRANYIFVLYDYDSNAIIVRPLRNHSAQEIQPVFTSVHAYLVARGL